MIRQARASRPQAAFSRIVRLALAAAVGATLSAAAPSPARADCESTCRSNYYICMRGASEAAQRTCSVIRDRCSSRCSVPRFGAIAFSEVTGVHGFSHGYLSRGDADTVALRNCRAQARDASDCRVLVWFFDACAALATGRDGAHGSAHGPSGAQASAQALAFCRPYGGETCQVARVVCSGR